MSLETKAQANVIYMQTQKNGYRITRQDLWPCLKSRQQCMVSSCECYMKKNVLWFRVSELHRRKNRAIKINPLLLTLRRASARRVSTSRINRWIITFVNRERVTAWRICNHDLQNFDNYTLNTWLKYSEMALVRAYFLLVIPTFLSFSVRLLWLFVTQQSCWDRAVLTVFYPWRYANRVACDARGW